MNRKTVFKYAVVVAVTICGSVGVYASNVSIASDDTNMLALANGAAVPTGDLVEIGTFSINDATIVADQFNFLALQANFTAYGSGAMGAGTVDGTHPSGYAGAFSLALGNSSSTFGGSLPIYLMVFNATSAATATGVAVIKSPTWVFPANTASGSIAIDLDDATYPPLIGSFSSSQFNEFAGGNVSVIELTMLIPEPSTYLLVGTGLLGLLGLRRRRS